MPSQEKKEKVKQIKKWFEKSDSLIVLHYRGLNVSEANELRGEITGLSGQLRVLKNTLTRIALNGTSMEGITEFIDGPVAVVFTNDDPSPLARAVREFSKGRKDFFLLGGVLEGRIMDAKQVESYALLPPREVLLAKMLGQMKAPLSSLVGVCEGPIRKMMGLFRAIADTKGPESAEAASQEEPESESIDDTTESADTVNNEPAPAEAVSEEAESNTE